MKHCKNCGHAVHDLFCAHCGQRAAVERISFTYVWQELFHFFTHINKGFIFTSWQMVVMPGKTVKAFIEGKRKKYQSPVSYFLIWITIYILFLFWLERVFGENKVINYSEYFGPGSTTKFAISHLSVVLTVVIPFQAFYLWLLVTKHPLNYFESMVATIYALGTVIMFQFLFAFFALVVHLLGFNALDLGSSDALKVLYLAWFIIGFIRLFPGKLWLIRALLFVLLAFGTFTLWRLYGLPEFIHWFQPAK